MLSIVRRLEHAREHFRARGRTRPEQIERCDPDRGWRGPAPAVIVSTMFSTRTSASSSLRSSDSSQSHSCSLPRSEPEPRISIESRLACVGSTPLSNAVTSTGWPRWLYGFVGRTSAPATTGGRVEKTTWRSTTIRSAAAIRSGVKFACALATALARRSSATIGKYCSRLSRLSWNGRNSSGSVIAPFVCCGIAANGAPPGSVYPGSTAKTLPGLLSVER